MRNWLRTLLFISAFSPALLSMAYVKYELSGFGNEVWQLCIIGLLGFFIPGLILKLAKSHSEVFSIQAKKIESNDFMLLAFVSSYLLPVAARFAEMSINAIFFMLLVLGGILWLVSSIPAHPLLRILNFRFYKLELSNGMVYTLISKRVICDPKDVKKVKKISDNMLMEDALDV